MAPEQAAAFGEWWDRAVNLASLIGLIVTAWATARLWGSQKHQDAARKPTVTVDNRSRFRRGAEPNVLTYSLDKDFRSVWQVEAVTVRWPPFKRALAPFSNPKQDGTGQVIYSPGLPYRWSVSFDEKTPSPHVFVSSSEAGSLLLSFRMSMRASPSIKSRFPVRINIRD